MIRIEVGDCLDVLRGLPDESVHCCICSPPYWGLRDYGVPGQLGLESTPAEYVARMVEVFREVRRVLRADGTCWVNLGDTYAAQQGSGFNTNAYTGGTNRVQDMQRQYGDIKVSTGLPPKNLVGIPWRVAFALQEDGWWLRQDIVWSKPNPMPESVTDRCTKAHEYVFLLAKSERYYFDADAIKEPATDTGRVNGRDGRDEDERARPPGSNARTLARLDYTELGRNRRSVWTVTTKPFAGAHFATFPPDLIEPMILAGCPAQCCAKCGAPWEREVREQQDDRIPYATVGTGMKARECRHDGNGFNKVLREDGRGGDLARKQRITLGFSPSCSCDSGVVPGTVLDPFGGAGTTGLVADRLQRNAILIELNPAYAQMARERIYGDAPLFVEVA